MSLTMAKKLVMERKKRELRELSLAELKLRPKNVKNVENLEAVPYPTAVRLPDPELNFLVEAGRFRYDRSFLLQFMSVCKERPESLAPLEALGLEPYNANAENSGARASSHRVGRPLLMQWHVAPFTQGTSGRPMFVPRSASRGGVRGGSPRQDRRTRSQHGNNRSESTGPSELQTPASQATGLHSVSQLETSENPSVATDALRIQRRQRLRVHRLAIVGRKVRALLNKLSTKEFDSITDKIVVWVNRSEVEKDGILLVRIVILVIEHAKDGAAFSEMYARLCGKIMEQISLNVQDETFLDSDGHPLAGGVLSRKYLLNGCQYEFERGWISKEITTAVASETTDVHATEALSQASGRPAPDSDGYYAAQAKRQGLGLVRFLCELFKLQILKERAMHACVITLFKHYQPYERRNRQPERNLRKHWAKPR
ncbi:eukaryotic translation initiation factor 4G, putative [Rhizoctonia solani AG-3 Rhs1AP]|uniref:Eukaryotic translation initiation factor 4G, putative n=1 Tax=Rhizoctonia solani AG-3 Rhs1AP TaxID=1086054 RepID=X8J887_9AGAM|nr:eukaryotic translation initiation factor 4G, putative [Rhizoctonia solani AG-3 Rhs1AP]